MRKNLGNLVNSPRPPGLAVDQLWTAGQTVAGLLDGQVLARPDYPPFYREMFEWTAHRQCMSWRGPMHARELTVVLSIDHSVLAAASLELGRLSGLTRACATMGTYE